jgi:hypothetical protein
MEVISKFWFSSILIQADVFPKEAIQDYELFISKNIYPYLTDNAKTNYTTIFATQLF